MVDGGGIYYYIINIGCSGYQYVFKMDNKINKDDVIIEKNGSKILIDKISLPFIEGAIIDYKDSMIKSAFLVVENPKAELSCSCGTSFAPKADKMV